MEMKDAISAFDFERVRFLLRFLADLVNTRVADVVSINEVFDVLMAARLEEGVPQVSLLFVFTYSTQILDNG